MQTDGKATGFWVGGMTVYGVSIFVANLFLFTNAKTYEKIGIFLLSLGPIAYFLFYWLFS